ncbi:hypothetical protein FRC05_003279 [Tulasnella sp. 425]|nr:hypothetical protein FRC05_003279 [Tulasnella sp. 425]
MMNLELLYAAEYQSPSDSRSLSNIATTHALTTVANHFHPSGGTCHVINYDQQRSSPEKPVIIKRWAHQGYADESVWGRGQAWALYGFARSAEWTDVLNRRNRLGDEAKGPAQEETDIANLLQIWPQNAQFEGDERLLEQAVKAADFFEARLGNELTAVPPWDFDCPDNPDGSLTFRDVSAGMIAASGMLTLHSLLRRRPGPSSSPYLSHALKIIRATIKYCSTPQARFTAGKPPAVDLGEGQWDTILNQSTINYNENAPWRKADCGLVYADYYFLEVGNKLLEMERRGWISSKDLN